jgi:xyloglucan:xyloglucosyl transferase
MACSYLCPCSLLICSLLAFLVSGSQIQKTLLPVISFDEGYTQLFGDDNLAIHRDGKTVHLSLDERTGTYPFMVSILGFRVMFFLLLLCVGFHWEFLCGFFYMQGLDLFLKTCTYMDTSVLLSSCLQITLLELWLLFM